MKQQFVYLLPLLVSGSVLAGQDANIKAPVLGYIFEQGRISTVAGLPGAARIVDGPELEADLEAVVFAPSGHRAIAVAKEAASLLLIAGLDATPALHDIPGLPPSFDAAAFSPDGSSVAVYNSACRCTYIIDGLAASPAVARRVDTPQTPRALAFNRTGDLAAAFDDRIDIHTGSGAVRSLPIPGATALAFALDGHLAVLEDGRNSITLIRDPAGAGAVLASIGERDGSRRPVAILFDSQNRLVALDDKGSVFHFDPSTSALQSSVCECPVAPAQSMGTANNYLLGAPDSGPLWVVTAGLQPRVFFVPPAPGGPR